MNFSDDENVLLGQANVENFINSYSRIKLLIENNEKLIVDVEVKRKMDSVELGDNYNFFH